MDSDSDSDIMVSSVSSYEMNDSYYNVPHHHHAHHGHRHESPRKSEEVQDSLLSVITNLYNETLPSELSPPKDVTFVVGAEHPKIISAHKFLLCARSPVFHTMFNGALAESSESIRIIDLDPVGFQNMLRYIYCDQMIDDFSQFSVTYMAADKYLVSGLCDKLVKFSKQVVSIENSTLIYDQYVQLGVLERFNLEDLEVDEIINLHAYLAFNSSDFLKIRKQTLIKLLEKNTLLIDELDLFSACVRWLRADAERQKEGESPVNQVKLFNSFKQLIRFPLIAEKDFFGARTRPFENDGEPPVIAPASTGLFTDDELAEFRNFYTSNDPSALSTSYNLSPRNDLRVAKLIFDWQTKSFRMVGVNEQLPDDGDFVYFEKGKNDKDGVYLDDRVKQPPGRTRPKVAAEKSGQSSSKRTTARMRPIVLSRALNSSEAGQLDDIDSMSVDPEPDCRVPPEEEPSEIRLFKVQKIGGNEEFEKQLSFEISENRYLSSMFHNRTKNNKSKTFVKDGASYLAFYPTLPLRTKCHYMIDFKNAANRYNAFAYCGLKLEQVFDVKDGERKLDVRATILEHSKMPVYELYFTY